MSWLLDNTNSRPLGRVYNQVIIEGRVEALSPTKWKGLDPSQAVIHGSGFPYINVWAASGWLAENDQGTTTSDDLETVTRDGPG